MAAMINPPSGGQTWKIFTLSSHPLAPLAYGLITFVFYLVLSYVWLSPDAIWSPDEGAKLLQMSNLRLEGGRLNTDIPYSGLNVDPDLRFAPVFLQVRGHALSLGRLPVFPLLSLPFYQMLGSYGLYLIPACAGAAICVLSCYLVAPASRSIGLWLLISLGSPVLIYAVIFWEHTLASSLILAGSWLVLNLRPPRRTWPDLLRWAGTSVIFALAIYMRPDTILFCGALLAATWLLVTERRWGIVWSGTILFILLLPYVPLHQIMFGGQSLPDDASYIFVPFAYIRSAQFQAIPDLLIGPGSDGQISSGWLDNVWAGAAVLAIICGFLNPDSQLVRRLLTTCWLICALAAAIFWFLPSYYRSGHGLLFTTPWALLGLSQTRAIWRSGDQRLRIFVLTTLGGLTAYAIFILVVRGSSPHGGMEWGARFALTFFPLLAILGLCREGYQRLSLIGQGAMISLVIIGFGMHARGIQVLMTDRSFSLELNQAISATPSRALITDRAWLPLNAAPIFDQKDWFFTPTASSLHDWAQLAHSHGVTDATLVTDQTELAALLAALDTQGYKPIHTSYVQTLVLTDVRAKP